MQKLWLLNPKIVSLPSVYEAKTDSIIHHLQNKINVLETAVHDSEISRGFFSEIIALQLSVFLFILGLSAFISWNWFVKKLQQNRDACTLDAESRINEIKLNTAERLDKISENLNQLNFDASRAMFLNARRDAGPGLIFKYSLRSAFYAHKLKTLETNHAYIFIVESLQQIQRCELGNKHIKQNISEHIFFLLELKESENEEIRNNSMEVNSILLSIAYHIPPMPDEPVKPAV